MDLSDPTGFASTDDYDDDFDHDSPYEDSLAGGGGKIKAGSRGSLCRNQSGAKSLNVKWKPNPNGRNGGSKHQSTIKNITDGCEKLGIPYKKEFRVKTPNGHKGTRYADIAIFIGSKRPLLIQVGKSTNAGLPVARERDAIEDLCGEGYIVLYIPYDK